MAGWAPRLRKKSGIYSSLHVDLPWSVNEKATDNFLSVAFLINGAEGEI